MKACILVPSHIRYDSQLDLFDKCLSSLINQTVHADIYVSISFENNKYRQDFDEKILKKYTSVNFKFMKHRGFQMEHLYNLLPVINNYDLVMFCDDDDTYREDRVEIFLDSYSYGIKIGGLLSGVREYISRKNAMSKLPDYWASGVKPEVLHTFFKRFTDKALLKHVFADMYFAVYLSINQTYKHWAGYAPDTEIEDDRLYFYNENNEHSICAENIASKNITNQIKNNLFLCLIKKNMKSYYEILKDFKIPDGKLISNDEKKRIIALCKKLYD